MEKNQQECVGRLQALQMCRAPAWEGIKATRPSIYYRNRHLCWSDTDMEDLRGSFSRLKKGIKHRFTGSKRKTDEPSAGRRGERAGASGSGNQGAELSDADWKYIVSSTAKSLLRGVRDTADVFPPLKSVAGGLCFVLENHEVWSPSLSAIHKAHRCPSE